MITLADGIVWFSALFVYASVFPHDISKTDAARITKLDTFVPRWVLKTLLFWGQKIKGQGHESQNSAGVGLCTFASAGFFYFNTW